jgi:hypothetical protein
VIDVAAVQQQTEQYTQRAFKKAKRASFAEEGGFNSKSSYYRFLFTLS